MFSARAILVVYLRTSAYLECAYLRVQPSEVSLCAGFYAVAPWPLGNMPRGLADMMAALQERK
jgi:hypothetical protein